MLGFRFLEMYNVSYSRTHMRVLLCAIGVISAIPLAGCSNLRAQLLSTEQTFDARVMYVVNGLEHGMDTTFTVDDGIVTALKITPDAADSKQRAEQLAFAANVRSHILGRRVLDLVLPDNVGESPDSERITRAFDEQALQKLKEDVL